MTQITTVPTLHIHYGGVSYDWDFSEMDIPYDASEGQIKERASQFLNTPVTKLQNFVLDRSTNGDVTLRPQAIFGAK